MRCKCICQEKEILAGHEAQSYLEQNRLKEVARAQGGWKYLLQCEVCGTYWEMSWEGGGGFDYGVMTLRRLSPEDLERHWSQVGS